MGEIIAYERAQAVLAEPEGLPEYILANVRREVERLEKLDIIRNYHGKENRTDSTRGCDNERTGW